MLFCEYKWTLIPIFNNSNKTIEIYYTNPIHQSNKYKAQDFIREWIPELKDSNNVEILIPWEFDFPDDPKPIEVFPKWEKAINIIKKLKP